MNEKTFNLINDHYIANADRLMKRFAWHGGSVQAGEDIIQSAYERAIKYYNDEIESFDGWFARICFNALSDYRKMEKGYSYDELDEELVEGIPCQQYNKERIQQIIGIINSKPPEQREKLLLHFKHGYSATDIHNVLGGPYITTAKLIQNFRKELKEMFQ